MLPAGVAAGFILTFRFAAPGVWVIALLLVGAASIYAVLGFRRPRQVSLLSDVMVIRPVIGKERRYLRSDIVSAEEITMPPLGSLVARVRDGEGRIRGVTVQHRAVFAGLGVRELGREVGMSSSIRGKLFMDWVGLPR
ncbi:MAG: hypothetical protein JWR59_1570 [Brevundimonas sp.]|nr:hypothetical protein [Brevundimonas sp.]